MRTIYVLMAVVAFSVVLLGASPVYASMQGDVDQAATIIERFQAVPEKAIPQAVLKDARGLAVMTVIKAGFGISGRGGTGVVVSRTRNGWSGPSAIGTGGAGFGLQIGAEVTEFVMILNTDAAVQAFSRDVNVTLGGDISVAAGPIGRNAEIGVTPVAAIYTYSRSQGLFAGVSLERSPLRLGPCGWSRYSHARSSPNAEATRYGRPRDTVASRAILIHMAVSAR